jgi:hypothetical protein
LGLASAWLSDLFFIEKSPKMLRGYMQKDDKLLVKQVYYGKNLNEKLRKINKIK